MKRFGAETRQSRKWLDNRVVKWFLDHAMAVTALLLLLVIMHFVASIWITPLDVGRLASGQATDATGNLISISLGMASVAAMVGGFAGVVVVFGLGVESDRFRLFRTLAGHSLRGNWTSVVLSPFAAAFGSLASAVVVLAGQPAAAIWLLEICCLVCLHAAVRLTVLLWALAILVDTDDQANQERAKESSVRDGAALVPKKH